MDWKKQVKKRNDKIKELHKKGLSYAEIGRLFGLTRQAIRAIIGSVDNSKK